MRTHRIVIPALCGAVLLSCAALPTWAQSPTTTAIAPVPNVPDLPLAIPMPPGMTVQTEIDLHDDDLLGVFKSLLRGVGQAANTLPQSTPRPQAVGTEKGPTDAQIAAILSNADLSDVFKDVTHIHFIMLTPTAPSTPMTVKPGKAAMMAGPPAQPDQTSFYETAFSAEGGHRIIYSNFDPVHVLMTSFGHAHGFAFMVQAPGTIAVLRADGYPDLSKLSALATSVGAAAGKAALNMPGSKLTK